MRWHAQRSDPHRWISVADAATRLGIGRADARALLDRRGLVRHIDGRPRVWLPALAAIDDESEAARRSAPAAGGDLPARGTLRRATLRPVK